MCTVTIRRDAAGVLLTMNRDEQRTRGAEAPPMLRRLANGMSWLAPLDTPTGGTWIGANSAGLAACILNGYLPGDDQLRLGVPPAPSRAAIVPSVLAMGGFEAAIAHLDGGFDPTPYQSFTLLLASLEGVAEFRWLGSGAFRGAWHQGAWTFWTSSSWNTAEVLAWRRAEFDRWLAGGAGFRGDVPAIHLHQPPGRAEWSCLMERKRTCTRSITQVQVAADSAELRWWAAPRTDLGLAQARVRLATSSCSSPQ